jgi:hypothetical protein
MLNFADEANNEHQTPNIRTGAARTPVGMESIVGTLNPYTLFRCCRSTLRFDAFSL